MSLKDTCHCGHDKASHYEDRSVVPPVRISCLCTGCTCRLYVHQDAPKQPKMLYRPATHSQMCSCWYCKLYREAREEELEKVLITPLWPPPKI